MKKIIILLILTMISLFLENSADQPEKKVIVPKKFGIEGGHFTCIVPKDWELVENGLKYNTRFHITFTGPRAEGAPVLMDVSYFGVGNKFFKDSQDFVTRNTIDLLDETIAIPEKVRVNGMEAIKIEYEIKEYLHPEAKDDASVMVKEKFYVLLARGCRGFFVLHFLSPSSAYAEHLPVFEKVAASFTIL